MVLESGAVRVGEVGCAGDFAAGGISSCAGFPFGVQLLGVIVLVADGVLSGCGLEKLSRLLGLKGDESGVVCLSGLDCDVVESRRRNGELRGEEP